MKVATDLYYSCTSSFVTVNKLEKEAELLFGKDWESEDDICQINKLLDHLNLDTYDVEWIEGKSNDEDIRVFECEKLIYIKELKAEIEKLRQF